MLHWRSVDAPLTLRWRSVDSQLKDILTVIGCSTIVRIMKTVIIDCQYIVSMYNHLHSKASRHISFWSTTIHVICAMNDIGPSQFSTSGREYTAYRFMHSFLTSMAQLSPISISSSLSSISMTYLKQFSKSRTCAASLSKKFCGSIHGLMQCDGCDSSGFGLRNDRIFYDSYDITNLNYVSTFRL